MRRDVGQVNPGPQLDSRGEGAEITLAMGAAVMLAIVLRAIQP